MTQCGRNFERTRGGARFDHRPVTLFELGGLAPLRKEDSASPAEEDCGGGGGYAGEKICELIDFEKQEVGLKQPWQVTPVGNLRHFRNAPHRSPAGATANCDWFAWSDRGYVRSGRCRWRSVVAGAQPLWKAKNF
ncbi:unnamed protein product [Tuber aestivum]|uniref:Uncharacterized protein n=1 Tax=Tuber aestivum TaxID=59557 RepID=A0A292PZ23_9PEZI|nr:unnamed protein product [Tuber aestivum]